MFEQRWHVRGDEILALAKPDDDPAGAGDPGGDDLPGILRRDERQRGGAVEQRQHRQRGRIQRLALRELFLQQMDRDLGVGLAGEAMPLRDERSFQLLEVLDDPVVDHGRDAAAIDVRVGVLLAGPAVRRPSRVADPGVAGGGMRGHDRCQVVELSFGTHDLEGPVLLHRDAGRVVPAVLEPAQAGHQQR